MKRPMHILHIETGRNLYGGALQVILLMEGLRKMGLRNTLVCPDGSAIAQKSSSFATVHGIPIKGELDPRPLFRLLRIIRKEKPDVVHVHSRRGADLWGGIAAKLLRVKAIVTRRVDNPEKPLVARAKYRMYDRVVTISKGIRRVLLQEGIPATKLTCVPSAVDPGPYRKACQRTWFQEEFGLADDVKAIGVIAQMILRKGHRFLIQAAPKILECNPEARFLFFGQGPLKRELESMCAENNLTGKVQFPGFRHDMERILPCLYLVVHPATMEGLGIALLQASAAGVPIVATRAGGIPEIVKHGQTGRLLRVGDVNGLAKAVVDLLKDPVKAGRFGKAGREMVMSRFSVDKMVEGYMELYRDIL